MFKLISIVISCLFITSCATTKPVLNTKTPLHIYGVSALSPNNGSWSTITSSGYQTAIGTTLKDNDSAVINISIYQIPEFSSDEEFLSHIIKNRAASPDIGRFELKENSEELAPLAGAICVKHKTTSQDNNARIKNNEYAALLIEYIGYNCIHPHKKSVGVHTEYSIRHSSSVDYPTFTKDADDFFSSIIFSEF